MSKHDDPGSPRSLRQRAAEQDLRATVDAVRHDAQRLAELEDEKAALAPDDPAVDRLSDEAVRVGERIAHETRAERQLGKDIR
jgi:hypothetical protein